MPEAEEPRVLDLPALRHAIRLGWPLIAAGVVLGLVTALAYGLLVRPRYTAETQIYLSLTGASSVQDLAQGTAYTAQLLQSYAAIAASPLVLDAVRSDLDLPESADLTSAVAVSAVTDSGLLDVQVTWGSAQGAADIANAIDRRLDTVSGDLSRDVRGNSTVELTSIARATPPPGPVTPNRPLALVVGLVAGLALGLLAALVRAASNRRIRNEEEHTDAVPAPFLGWTSFSSGTQRFPLSVWTNGREEESERYRSIRTNLRYLSTGGSARTLLVTSALPGEGKTTLAANLAVALTQTGRTVTLVEADMRRPRMAAMFGIDGGLGLSDALSTDVPLEESLQHIASTPLLTVMAAGPKPPNPSELLAGERMRQLVTELEARSDFVVIDAPPMLPVADASVLAPEVDAVLLVAASGRSVRSAQRQAFSMLQSIGARQVALVLTMVRTRRASRYYAPLSR